MVTLDYREPSLHERALMDLLTAPDFPGAGEIREQLRSCNVRQIDAEGSLGLQIQNPVRASVIARVPVELSAPDTDGVDVHVLLHVVNGICQEIEIYKDAPGPIGKLPERWRYFVPSSNWPNV
ncbi:DUF6984 family protein [Paraburkholderia sp. DHOC27]|uniref:DUF6984 family protein n=1 Tax=Paraburkholderia sp. DHOC27 TaxID=2303330 RepID=UPI0011C19353|nr:hypothetical protein [Paraburkholderia sp. DHOC27]